MQVVRRICLEDLIISNINTEESIQLKRGREYLTTLAVNNKVTVFTNYWIKDIDVKYFAGEKYLKDLNNSKVYIKND